MGKITACLYAAGNDSIRVKKKWCCRRESRSLWEQNPGEGKGGLSASAEMEQSSFKTRIKPKDQRRGGDRLTYWVVGSEVILLVGFYFLYDMRREGDI